MKGGRRSEPRSALAGPVGASRYFGRNTAGLLPFSVACATILGGSLGGCSPSEAEQLAAAGAAADASMAAALCDTLPGDSRDRCLVAQADRFAVEAAWCDRVPGERWRGECRFRAAERLVRAGDPGAATALCVSTPFARECTYHLLRESARTVLDQPPATAAAALTPWLAEPGAHDAPKLYWKAYFRERRGSGAVDDPTGCPDEACTDAARETFFETVRATFRADRDGFCAAPPASVNGWAVTPDTSAWLATWADDACARAAAPPQAIPAAR